MGRLFTAAAFAAAAMAFALPFGFVTSCDGGEVQFTGAELATFGVPVDEHDVDDRELRDELETSAGPFALGLLVAALCGIVVAALGVWGIGLCAALGVVLAQLLLYAIVLTGDQSSELFAGYWLALAAIAGAAAIALVRAARSRSRTGRSGWALAAFSVAVLAPPLGAVVSALGWLVVLAVRLARRGFVAVRASH